MKNGVRRKKAAVADAAFVIRRFPYGESSLVVHLLTRDHGRVAVLAKGAYRLRSRYFGVLDYFDTLAVRWRGGKELGNLTEASILERRRLTVDLGRYRAALSTLELAGLGARDGEGDPTLFERVRGSLDTLGAGTDPTVALIAFDLRFLGCMGLAPALESCASCGRVPRAGRGDVALVCVGAGGRLCEPCATDARAGGRIVETLPLNVLRVARSLMETPSKLLPRTRVDGSLLDGVRGFVQRFLDHHLETRPRSRRTEGEGPLRRRRLRSTARPAR